MLTKSYSVDVYKQALERASIPNNENFDNPDIAHNDFINRFDCEVNAIAPFKIVSEWFEGEIADKYNQLHKRFKLTKLYVDEEIYKEGRNRVQNLIGKKEKAYFEEKLKENTKNPTTLWKTLQQLGLPDK